MDYRISKTNFPQWREVMVGTQVPQELKRLDEIAHNLWWTWHYKAMELFRDMNPLLWEEVEQNPIRLLARMDYGEMERLAQDGVFLQRLEEVYENFRKYMKEPPNPERPSVAYFCMEFGLHKTLKIYSGGLGILAGDYLKEASDSNVDMCGVGLLYRYGYFDQSITMDGQQVADYEAQKFSMLPIEKVVGTDNRQLVIHVPYAGFTVHAKVWKVSVGRVPLYLLDTNNEMNSEYDRPITHYLYGGDWENRLKQEILLGIGGMMLLKELGIEKDIYHCNEGHAALLNLQRLCNYIDEGKTFVQALELVRASSLYTVHTPVPAGHDYFNEDLFRKYMNDYANRLGISWDSLMDMGRYNAGDKGERFCMSIFACNTCQEVNGVSLLHKKVSQEMFSPIWKGYFPEENHVDYVTNGVHLPTWCATEWQRIYTHYLGENFLRNQADEKQWEAVFQIPDKEIWQTRIQMKRKLLEYASRKYKEIWMKKQMDPHLIMSAREQFRPDALLIGFARRFATYKRAHLLFSDLERLGRIINNPDHPVRFIFAGKAHPNDGAGQGLIKQIIEISHRPEFLGKIVFLENYDMELARRLVSGVDIWLNTPTRKAEASGTSGEKALMNGVLNFSVPDGWWYEGYREKAGWKLLDENTYQNPQHQDELDAASIYYMLEHEIVPLYYSRNEEGYPKEWIEYIKNSIVRIAPHYTMKRQLDDYYEKFYSKLYARCRQLNADNGYLAIRIADWKRRVVDKWGEIEIKSIDTGKFLDATISAGKEYNVTVVVDEKGLEDAVGIELVVIRKDGEKDHVHAVEPLELVGIEGDLYTFRTACRISNAGNFRIAFRMYPKNSYLPHRDDFCYVRWF